MFCIVPNNILIFAIADTYYYEYRQHTKSDEKGDLGVLHIVHYKKGRVLPW